MNEQDRSDNVSNKVCLLSPGVRGIGEPRQKVHKNVLSKNFIFAHCDMFIEKFGGSDDVYPQIEGIDGGDVK
jgi:hypothetical protein